ncbi:MAG: MFS transporter [Planctomycetaceae bacterium]|nr:MFS transporter [Planctomycetaceae bacterium]
MSQPSNAQPTNIRWLVLSATTLTSFMLYLDRVCIGNILASASFKSDIDLTSLQQDWIISGFFWAYALCQVPAGYLSDRFGARGMLAFYVAVWSLFTMLGGFAAGFATLLAARVGLAVVQAGAYPTSVGLLSTWMPFKQRALCSSVVATGGRIGGAVAPILTAWIIGRWDWRPALFLYGLAGLGSAWFFYQVFRTSPEEHPACNDAECALIHEGRPESELHARRVKTGMPWGPLLSSFGMWLNCLVQFCTNVGWVFIVGQMPRYLIEVKGMSELEAGSFQTIAMLCGMVGMMMGGVLVDYSTRRLGVRWGRAIPIAGSRFISTLAYVACLWLDDPWAIVAAIAAVSFTTDLGVGGVWAYTQDVGGRYTGAILGWGNMWGNIGAALSPIMANYILQHYDANQDWREVFVAFSSAFGVSAVAGLGLDGTKLIVSKAADAR